MQNFIHTVALLASLLALVAGLWQDWGVLTTVKRMLVSYLLFFSFGSLLSLSVRALLLLEGKAEFREGTKTMDRGRNS
jgi:hypothetical protein